MPYAQRLLENGFPRLLENEVIRALELVPAPSQNVGQVYPKTWYAWTDRTGITNPDVTGPCQLANLTPVSTADAGTLVITADGTAQSMTIGIAVVLWDERGNPISVTRLSHHAQRLVQKRGRELHWSQRGNNLCPWVPRGRCLPRGRVHRARPVDHSQRQREPAHQALLIVGPGRIVERGWLRRGEIRGFLAVSPRRNHFSLGFWAILVPSGTPHN